MPRIPLPTAGEYAPDYSKYLAPLSGDMFALLQSQAKTTAALLAATPESRAGHRYAQGKWSVQEVVGYLSDSERVFSYRALRFARADTTDLPGFEENDWVANAHFDRRTWRRSRRTSRRCVLQRSPSSRRLTTRSCCVAVPPTARRSVCERWPRYSWATSGTTWDCCANAMGSRCRGWARRHDPRRRGTRAALPIPD